ncbi:MAG TPA: replicative DNA helicase [Candidatus Cloacimonadota bacterium]|nr:replicative DNA helicase [Candidatus Cloacimonadota bacterium]
MADRVERQLPNDINAEAAVLSAMMMDNFVVAKAIENLEPDNFYRKAHEIIFRNIVELFEANIEVDIITLIDRLRTNSELEKVGGESFINELSDVVLSGANAEYHINIVLEKALLRQLITASNRIIESCYNSDDLVEDIVDSAEQAIFKIAERPNRKAFQSIAKIIPKTIQNIEETATTKKNLHGVPSGFTDLDRKIGGFRPGQLIVLAARPAMGKTSLALNIASNAAVRYEKRVGIFTMEMEAEELLMRILSSASEVEMENMLKGVGMNEKKLLRIAGAAEVLAEKHIYIDDNGSNTILDIRAKTRRLQAEIKGLDMIIIDYMQLMSVKRNRENRQQEISEISRNLKVLAKEINIPIIALSQLNRGVESRDDKRPKLSDLRESGAIEQDADLVMFIYRDEVYNEDTTEKPGIAEIIIGKNRHGSIGTVELRFDAAFTAFRDINQYD